MKTVRVIAEATAAVVLQLSLCCLLLWAILECGRIVQRARERAQVNAERLKYREECRAEMDREMGPTWH